MRRIALLVAVIAVLGTAVTAWAATNTLSYGVTIKKAGKGKPSKKKPIPISYIADLTIDTDPPGNQPDIAPVTTIYFPEEMRQNAKYFPSCTQSEIDGKTALPRKCRKAIVGKGTATAFAGQPGSPTANSVREDLTVTAVNGDKGKKFLLVLNSAPGAPVAINNRVVPGTLGPGADGYAYTLKFEIPEDLQMQLGLSIALSKFDVVTSAKRKTIKRGRKKKKIAYLELVGCPAGGLDIKAVATFRGEDGSITEVPSESKAAC